MQTILVLKIEKLLIDLSIPQINNGKLIIFIHGYMGYKDWGCWNLVERYFNKRIILFL